MFGDGDDENSMPHFDKRTQDQITNNFQYHPPKGDQQQRYVELRTHAKLLAVLINGLVPNSREKSVAMTKLEEAVMWSNAGIARNE